MTTTKQLLTLLRFLDNMPDKEKKDFLSFLLALRDSGDIVTPHASCFPKEKE